MIENEAKLWTRKELMETPEGTDFINAIENIAAQIEAHNRGEITLPIMQMEPTPIEDTTIIDFGVVRDLMKRSATAILGWIGNGSSHGEDPLPVGD